jgi:trehalose 6-phosphate phosphatase
MQLLPLLTPENALFLDFDGTLAEIAPLPDAVRVPSGLVHTLASLQAQLGGALAIVTGRREADIDGFLSPLRLTLASEHGARYRLSDGSRLELPPPDLLPVTIAAQALVDRNTGLVIERKNASVALHYRLAPQLQAECRNVLVSAMAGMQDVELLEGKCVYEVKPVGVNKGRAINAFMSQPPFAGRIPVFVGDDVTDEAGFFAVRELGGAAIKVGEGPTHAQYRCLSPAALRGWLASVRTALPPAQGPRSHAA